MASGTSFPPFLPRRSLPARQLVSLKVLLAVCAIWGMVVSFFSERSIAFWGSVASIVVLLLVIHLEWIRPYLRTRRLKKPVKAHFTIRQNPDSDIEPRPTSVIGAKADMARTCQHVR